MSKAAKPSIEAAGQILLFDFGSRDVEYGGEAAEGWFVCQPAQPELFFLDHAGKVLDWFPCPSITEVRKIGQQLIGLNWGPKRAAGYEVTTGKRLWLMDGGVTALVGERFAIGRLEEAVTAPSALFDLVTGVQLWSFETLTSPPAHPHTVKPPLITADQDRVYVAELDGTTRALDLRTGAEVWKIVAQRKLDAGLNRPLVVDRLGLWYHDLHSVLVCLSRETGETVAEVPFDGDIRDLVACGEHLLICHELGVASMSGGVVASVVDDLYEAKCVSDGKGFACLGGHASNLLWCSEFGGQVSRAKLDEKWEWHRNDLRVANGVATLSSRMRLLRWPLATVATKGAITATRVVPQLDKGDALEDARVVFGGASVVSIEHPTRGRFTLTVANTGLKTGAPVQLGGFIEASSGLQTATVLAYQAPDGTTVRTQVNSVTATPAIAAGATVEVGKVRPPSKLKVPKPFKALATALHEVGLVPALSDVQLFRLHTRLSDEDETRNSLTARFLQQVHQTADGLAYGYLAHDWRFGSETGDVIAEFARCLEGEPIVLKQLGTKPGALHISTTIAGQITEEWVSVEDGGLDNIAHFINLKLGHAGAARRIHSLQTDEDWLAYIVRTPAEVDMLIERGVRGFA